MKGIAKSAAKTAAKAAAAHVVQRQVEKAMDRAEGTAGRWQDNPRFGNAKSREAAEGKIYGGLPGHAYAGVIPLWRCGLDNTT
jgi:hypothetical protein